jgi:hypothetical protein
MLTLLAVACGGGDKKSEPTSKPADRPTATAEADPTEAAEPTAKASATAKAEPTEEASNEGGGGDGVSALFSTVFSNGFSGGGSAAGLSGGDESLKAYLPEDSDFPSGFTPFGSFTFSAPADSSELGAVDMAMTMAMKGDPAALAGATDPSEIDFSSIEMLVAMVMRPEDLQSLGDIFGEIEDFDPETLQEEIDSGFQGMEGFEVTNFDVLDASGLGDGGFGMEMTIDMSGFSSLFGALGGGDDAPTLEAMTMRMYVFGKGDHIGAVMRMGFTDSLDDDGSDVELAEIIDGKLP